MRRIACFAFVGPLLLLACSPPATANLNDRPASLDQDTPDQDKPMVEGTRNNPDASAPSTDKPAPTKVDAGISLDGTTWTGTYSGQKRVGSCFANNAGNLTVKFTEKAAKLSSKVEMTGIDLRNTLVCSTAGTTNGSSGDSDTQLTGQTLFGVWSVSASGPTSEFSYPFMAQLSGNTLKGTWRCDNCPGDFSLTKQ